jgi:hypothetical protein
VFAGSSARERAGRPETKNDKRHCARGLRLWLFEAAVTDLELSAQCNNVQGRVFVCRFPLPRCAGGNPAFILFWLRANWRRPEQRGKAPEASPVSMMMALGERKMEQYLGELLIHAPVLCSSRERGVAAGDQEISERLPCLERAQRLRSAQLCRESHPWCSGVASALRAQSTLGKPREVREGRRGKRSKHRTRAGLAGWTRGLAEELRESRCLSFPNCPRVHTRGRSVSATGLVD